MTTINAPSKVREELVDAIAGHWVSEGEQGFELSDDSSADIADYLLKLGYRKPCTIESVEELEALPVGSVIVDRDGDAWQRYSTGWTCTDRAMNTVDQPSASLVNILGPATVLLEARA